jgi:hypothetical protein
MVIQKFIRSSVRVIDEFRDNSSILTGSPRPRWRCAYATLILFNQERLNEISRFMSLQCDSKRAIWRRLSERRSDTSWNSAETGKLAARRQENQ